ncbi:shikimate kinase, partial [Peribacillus sp. NPDC056705]|uniref:shikimate kinase n=1 Tax=Peribacillus sp. NPDC056705 TaxID=3345918 RepID=UPI003747DE5F
NGFIMYLHVPYEEIEKRITNLTTRGIVYRRGNSLREIYEERVPLYMKYSDITINCDNKDTEQCVREMKEEWRRFDT